MKITFLPLLKEDIETTKPESAGYIYLKYKEKIDECFKRMSEKGREYAFVVFEDGTETPIVEGHEKAVAQYFELKTKILLDFHTHPTQGSCEFSGGDILVQKAWNARTYCLGCYNEQGQKQIVCITRIADQYPYKCRDEVVRSRINEEHSITEEYESALKKIKEERKQLPNFQELIKSVEKGEKSKSELDAAYYKRDKLVEAENEAISKYFTKRKEFQERENMLFKECENKYPVYHDLKVIK